MTNSPFATPRGSISIPGEQTEPDRTPRGSISGPPSPVQQAQAPAALGLPKALKPIGIINEQNTCFLNSTFQALSATAPLISLVTESSSSSLHPVSTASLPRPVISPARIPSLQPEALEPPLYSLLPVTRAFITALHTAWKKKDAAGGTSGPSETRSDRCMSLRSVLREIAKKYDQYDDYRQQDAHELLRHLLDSMEMEEKDVIKKLQPVPTPEEKRNKAAALPLTQMNVELAGISPLPSPLPSPAGTAPTSPVRSTHPELAMQSSRSDLDLGPAASQGPIEIPENERMIPFVDVLFGGSLASIVICEKCKSVSHTYEGFLDISLSLKGDDSRPRKRDKIKAFFSLGGSKSSKSSASRKDSLNSDSNNTTGVFSDGEFSDADQPSRVTATEDRDRRASLDSDDRYSEGDAKRNVSLKSKLKPKSSFPFRRKGSRPSSSQSIPSNGNAASQQSSPGMDPERVASPLIATSSITSSPSGSLGGVGAHNGHHAGHGVGPSPAQAAYISRILSHGSPTAGNSGDSVDPLAKLRAANSGQGLSVNDSSLSSGEYSLIDCLRAFTSVEVLEGENAFACKKCWKIQSGKYEHTQPVLHEEDEDAAVSAQGASSPEMSASRRNAPPSISVMSPDTPDAQDSGADGRSIVSTSSLGSRGPSVMRAPSPLRRSVRQESDGFGTAAASDTASLATDGDFSVDSSDRALSITTSNTETLESESISAGGGAGTTAGSTTLDSDGLSDTSSSEDEEPPNKQLAGRPKMPARRKSTHFVMRRAFKRYLIAKEPEVLVFHLKRFRQTQKGLVFASFYDLKKVDDFVPFPPMLDLSPFLAPDRNDYKAVPTATGPRAPFMDWASPEQGPEHMPVMYKLYAIVVHLGTMIGGHYIAYTLVEPDKMFEQGQEVVDAMRNMDLDDIDPANPAAETDGLPRQQSSTRNGEKDRRVWCFCSDTSIRLASVDEVLRARAYLCFYEKA